MYISVCVCACVRACLCVRACVRVCGDLELLEYCLNSMFSCALICIRSNNFDFPLG